MSENVLKKSLNSILKNQFEYIIDHLDECVLFLDSELKVLSLNKKASELCKCSEEECLEKYCYEILHGRSEPCDDCPVKLAIKDGQVHKTEKKLQDDRQCLIKSIPIFTDSNELKGIIEIIQLRSEQKEEPQSEINLESEILGQKDSSEDKNQNSLKDDAWFYDIVKKTFHFSKETAQKVGLQSQNEYDLKTILEKIHTLDRADLLKQVRKASPEKLYFEFNLRIFKNNEQFQRFYTDAYFDFDKKGNIVSIRGALKPDRDHGYPGKRSKIHDNVLKSLWDNMPVGVMTKEIDDKLKITLWNKKMIDIYGYSEEQVLGKTDEELYRIHNLDLSAGDESILNNRSNLKERTEIFKKGDIRKVLKTQKTPIVQENEDVTGILCVVEDVTEKERDQERVREREARFRAIFNNVLLSVIIINNSGYIIYGNDHFYEAFDIEENNEIEFNQLIHPDFRKQHAEIVRKIYNNELRYYSSELKFLLEPGNTFWANVVTTPIKNNQGKISSLLIMAEDITEKKHMEAHLRQSEKMSAIGQLAHGIAHDFKNQLAGIMGYAQILNTKMKDQNLKRYIEKIIDTTDRATSLTQKLSDFARKEPKVNKPVKVNKIIHETVEMLKPSLNQSIKVEVNLSTEDEYVLGDPVSLQNALLNLCINAKDAMPDGGRLELNTETIHLKNSDCINELHVLTPGQYVKISVTDNGIGMDEATKKKAFEPFYTTKEKGKGTGLGLASVFSTIEKHKGALTIWSAQDVGSSINIFLPLTKEAENETELDEKDSIEINEQGGHILYVEDEDDIREVTIELLKEGGFTVTAFGDPKRALSFFQKNWQSIDLVLSDVVMPEMKGDELFRSMKKVNQDVKVILNSGYTDEAQIQQALDDGIKSFLKKPVQKTELWNEINRLLKT